MNPARPASWIPYYETHDGRPYRIEGAQVMECPVSLIKPATRVLVQLFGASKFSQEATGATLYGPSLLDWPAKAYDVALLIERQRGLVDEARYRAEREEQEARSRRQ